MKSSASEITGKLRRLSARIWNPASVRDHGHRLPASVARRHEEEDWDPDQPQIRMSRAFAVMLVLHLVAVGGLFAFHVFGKDDQNAEQQATRQANAGSVPPPARPVTAASDSASPAVSNPAGLAAAVAAGAAPPRAQEISEDTPVDGAGNQYQVHVMLPGESKVLVAARYGITAKELEAANPGMEFRAGSHLTIPQSGQRVITSTPGAGARAGNPPVAVLAASNSQEPGAREFAMKTGPESVYQRDDHPVAEAASPPTRSSPASAKPTERTASKSKEKSIPRAARVSDDGDHPPKTKQTREKTETAKTKTSTQSGGGSRTHVVQKGDTVYNVSRRYGLSASEVMKANNISDPGKLQLGQVLRITVRH